LRFDVIDAIAPNLCRAPDYIRLLPEGDLHEVMFQRDGEFNYDSDLWPINSLAFDPNRVDVGIEQGTAELWPFRNAGDDWAHPIRCHFTESRILEVNGLPLLPTYV
jgi:FtsP/CotA-like multicopper oxidase with cupredoxin domain